RNILTPSFPATLPGRGSGSLWNESLECQNACVRILRARTGVKEEEERNVEPKTFPRERCRGAARGELDDGGGRPGRRGPDPVPQGAGLLPGAGGTSLHQRGGRTPP